MLGMRSGLGNCLKTLMLWLAPFLSRYIFPRLDFWVLEILENDVLSLFQFWQCLTVCM